MRYSTSCSHEWDHAREEFLSIAKEQMRNQSLQMARVIGPVRKVLRECGTNSRRWKSRDAFPRTFTSEAEM